MCGIYGSIIGTKIKYKPVGVPRFLSDATRVGVLRGEDSTGMFQVDKKKDLFVIKQAVPGYFFLNSRGANRYIEDSSDSLVTVGHHRAATHGIVNNDNAHPFLFRREDKTRFVGVHNGVISSFRARQGDKKFDVDSEWLLDGIASKGWDFLEDINGSFALVTYDERDHRVRVACNEDRNLHFSYVKDEPVLLMASESAMLYWLAGRNGVTLEEYPVKFEAGKIYTINPDSPREVEISDIPKKKWEAPPVENYAHSQRKWRENRNNTMDLTNKHGRGSFRNYPARASRKAVAEERDFCKLLGLEKAICNFRVTGYDTVSETLNGDATIITGSQDKNCSLNVDDAFPAEIRNVKDTVGKILSSAFNTFKYLQCQVVGVQELRVNGNLENKFVLGNPMKVVRIGADGKETSTNFRMKDIGVGTQSNVARLPQRAASVH